MLLHLETNRFGQSMQDRNLIKSRLVERAAYKPAFSAVTIEIALAKIFQPDQTLDCVVKINLRNANSVLAQKIRDGHVMPVFFPLQIVLHQNERLLRGAANAIEFAV